MYKYSAGKKYRQVAIILAAAAAASHDLEP